MDVDGDLSQLVLVLTGMVPAEQQLGARRELDTDVRLSAAAIATVARGEGGEFSSSCHDVLFLQAISVGSTYVLAAIFRLDGLDPTT